MLVNNAGITSDNLSMRMKDEEWQNVLDTNLTGTFRLIRSFPKGMMKARYGRIINISSGLPPWVIRGRLQLLRKQGRS